MQFFEILKLDVWAGEEEGLWDVNNFFPTGEEVMLKDTDGKEALIKQLQGYGYTLPWLDLEIDMDSSESYITIARASDCYPILHLKQIEPPLELEKLYRQALLKSAKRNAALAAEAAKEGRQEEAKECQARADRYELAAKEYFI